MTAQGIIEKKACSKICQELAHILASTYVLYVKTQNFHWNIVDPRFYSLHKMLEKQYEELAKAIDEIAERMRMLKGRAPGSLQEMLTLSLLQEAENDLSGDAMLFLLLEDHDAMANHLRPLIPATQKQGDEGTADLFIDLLRFHEKTAWMLRSHFED